MLKLILTIALVALAGCAQAPAKTVPANGSPLYIGSDTTPPAPLGWDGASSTNTGRFDPFAFARRHRLNR